MLPSPTETPTRRTPGDFQLEADKLNSRIADNAMARQQVQAGADALNAEREALISRAAEFGVTAKYGRAALRKA